MNKTTFPKQFPRLETERLILRALTPDDAQAVLRNFSDPEVVEHLMEPFTSLAQAESIVGEFIAAFEKRKGLFWAVTLKQGGAFLGTCSFESVELDKLGEVGFDLTPPHWGKGLMSEALRAVMGYGFECLGLTEIEAFTSIHN
ncbi:MAG: GNAT family N-acetyltransferase, partial [Chloroflexi bacterium]|nr:GNAT family N-acetyltransferase [Chloroflexota bacterium]